MNGGITANHSTHGSQYISRLVKTALLLFLAVWVLQKLQLLVTPELVSKTVLLKFFAQNSPIDLIAKL